jgi:hypothetical protein
MFRAILGAATRCGSGDDARRRLALTLDARVVLEGGVVDE